MAVVVAAIPFIGMTVPTEREFKCNDPVGGAKDRFIWNEKTNRSPGEPFHLGQKSSRTIPPLISELEQTIYGKAVSPQCWLLRFEWWINPPDEQ
jgi:hypothetical protein|uniref:Uncharacterized protein n=1 Tax=Picea sitchensis TaxID=3332 RepID=A0A6B9XWF5_PICSI|nr:hypothetical protein Q903MT_gene5708 [Picea sitchensis]